MIVLIHDKRKEAKRSSLVVVEVVVVGVVVVGL